MTAPIRPDASGPLPSVLPNSETNKTRAFITESINMRYDPGPYAYRVGNPEPLTLAGMSVPDDESLPKKVIILLDTYLIDDRAMIRWMFFRSANIYHSWFSNTLKSFAD